MKTRRLRSGLITAAIIAAAGAAWLFFAPTRIGGRTTYVVTSGISMQPRFHTGDLALVQPSDHYRVGQIVAYHSSLLKTVVLHRIVAIHGGRYTFKGDNNDFLDPVHPTRSQLVGALWLRVAHGGRVLKALHSTVTIVLLCVFVGLLVVGGTERRRGRRRRERPGAQPRAESMSRLRDNASLAPSLRTLLIVVGAVAAASLALAGFGLDHPATRTATHNISYSQSATFSYHAQAARGVVYPDGVVHTGDPIFLTLVHRVDVGAVYRFTGPEVTHPRATVQLMLHLTGPSGWSRSIALTPLRHLRAVQGAIATTLDLNAVQSLLQQVARQTGLNGTFGNTVSVTLAAHMRARVLGQLVDQSYSAGQNFSLAPLELEPATAGPPAPKKAAVSTTSVVSDPVSFLGHRLAAGTLAALGLGGFVLCVLLAVPLGILLQRNRAFDEAARIRARYSHLLVPILIGEDLGWPPVDVTSFKALVRLAEAAGQVILHHQADAVDTYLVNDNGTVYRYQIALPLVSWGEWTETNLAADAAALAGAATALAQAAAPSETPASA